MRNVIFTVICLMMIGNISWGMGKPPDFDVARKKMVETQIKPRGITDEKVLKVMGKVPRHEFVLPQYTWAAYADRPLPIGEGQTISQPYIVALMTMLLDLKPGQKVLEIGTGSGYQAAVLGELVEDVYTIEIIEKLGKSARSRLKELGYKDIKVKIADGYFGWEEHAPFDTIIVTASPDHIPRPLIRQLKEGGMLLIPVGPPGGYQTLWRVKKSGEKILMENIMPVRFVPLLRR